MRVCFALILLLNVEGLAAAAARSWQQPNFVLLVATDLGREWLPCYGGAEVRTPAIDRLAANGALFASCYATPMPSISQVELLTGRYPFRTGWMWDNDVAKHGPPELDSAREISFATLLQAAGYRTAFTGGWALNRVEGKAPVLLAHGFEANRITDDLEACAGFISDFVSDANSGPFAICAFLPSVREGQRFQDHVLGLDRLVQQVTATITKVKLDRQTLVILTSTCGTAGQIARAWGNQPAKGGKGTLLEVGINVPLIVSGSYWVQRGQVPLELVDLTDLLPTLIDLAGGRLPRDRELDGRSFASVLYGRGMTNPREWIFSQHGGDRVIRNAHYKLYSNGRCYDVVGDLLEQQNLAQSSNSEMIGERERLAKVLRSLPSDRPLAFPYARRIIVRRPR